MSTNFLALLKQRNQQLTGSTPDNVGIKIDSDFGTPNQTLVNLTTGKDLPKFFPNQPQVGKQIDKVTGPITVRCERVLDKNRLDLFFSAVPANETRQDLKDNGFKWDGDRVCWYHKDDTLNRLYLADKFNLPELLQDSFNDEIKPKVASDESHDFTAYKMQVNALAGHLGLDPADLVIKAIDCLYYQTFKPN